MLGLMSFIRVLLEVKFVISTLLFIKRWRKDKIVTFDILAEWFFIGFKLIEYTMHAYIVSSMLFTICKRLRLIRSVVKFGFTVRAKLPIIMVYYFVVLHMLANLLISVNLMFSESFYLL
jgi:hypothetical protein